MKKDKNQEIASAIMEAVNCFGFDEKRIVKYMSEDHRTLQQSFTKVCVEWLRTLATTSYYDHRNEASVYFAKALMNIPEVQELIDSTRFPMI